MVKFPKQVGLLALAVLVGSTAVQSQSGGKVVRQNLRKGQCTRLEAAKLCLDGDYFATLYVNGRKVEFNAGGVVSDQPGAAVPVELALSGKDYRVKVQNWSMFDVPFARFNQITFRRERGGFRVTGYVVNDTGRECEPGIDVTGTIDFVTGQVEAVVEGRVRLSAATLPAKQRLPDLFKFDWGDLGDAYGLYSVMAQAEARYCEAEGFPPGE